MSKSKGTVLFLISLIGICPLWANSATDDTPINDDSDLEKVYYKLDSSPEYPGGLQGLAAFLSENLNYPQEAVEAKIEGIVRVAFIVEKDGSVSDVKAINTIDPNLDAEAIRVVKLLKGWKPGMINNKEVRCKFVLPVSFRLQ